MPDLSYRSREEEMLDQDHLDREELFLNLKELDRINALLGGHRASIEGLKQLIKRKDRSYRIVDFACGGGDTLRKIHDWGKEQGFQLELSGFDLLPEAIEYAKSASSTYDIQYSVEDFKEYDSEKPIDIAICALVCHHFYDEDLQLFLKKMRSSAKLAVVINDLHRHPFAYYSIKYLTHFFSNSSYVKNDAPLSVWRGFKADEWKRLLSSAGYQDYQIKWVWAFRHLIIEKMEEDG